MRVPLHISERGDNTLVQEPIHCCVYLSIREGSVSANACGYVCVNGTRDWCTCRLHTILGCCFFDVHMHARTQDPTSKKSLDQYMQGASTTTDHVENVLLIDQHKLIRRLCAFLISTTPVIACA